MNTEELLNGLNPDRNHRIIYEKYLNNILLGRKLDEKSVEIVSYNIFLLMSILEEFGHERIRIVDEKEKLENIKINISKEQIHDFNAIKGLDEMSFFNNIYNEELIRVLKEKDTGHKLLIYNLCEIIKSEFNVEFHSLVRFQSLSEERSEKLKNLEI